MKLKLHETGTLNNNNNKVLPDFFASGPATGMQALQFVKDKGGCVYGYNHDFQKQEWYNQRRLHMHYFHTVFWEYFPTTYSAWVVLKTDPYFPIYQVKFMHMEQAGLMELMSGQWNSFKPMESEELEPLKLPHFYITMIGIAAGISLSFIAFALEKLWLAKAKKSDCIKVAPMNVKSKKK